jgi:hypothetical protein
MGETWVRSLIHTLPTFPATLATPQSAAVIAGCDRAWQDEEVRSLIHSLQTFPVMLATPQSATVIAECDRVLQDERMRSLIHYLLTSPATLATAQSEKCNCCPGDRFRVFRHNQSQKSRFSPYESNRWTRRAFFAPSISSVQEHRANVWETTSAARFTGTPLPLI